MYDFVLFLAASVVASASSSSSQQPLPRLNIDPDTITVSGFSSGGVLVPQFHLAYSANVSGAASWAGKPYLVRTDEQCNQDPINCDVSSLVEKALLMEAAGQIDPSSNLENDRVFIFHGTEDRSVDPDHAPNSEEFYQSFMAKDLILLKNDIPCLHAMVSDWYGSPCGVPNHIYAENCGYDSMFQVLNFILGGDLRPPSFDYDVADFVPFNQNIYFSIDGGDAYSAGLSEEGYTFVPPQCQDGTKRCKLHVYFHGCHMNVEEWGYNAWLEMISGLFAVGTANDIAFLFPQTSSDFPVEGEEGCWNVNGYLDDREGAQYATKEAKQMKGIYRMMQAIVG